MKKIISFIFCKTYWLLKGSLNRISLYLSRPSLEQCGDNVHYSFINSNFTPLSNISIGNDVYIGPNATILCTESKVKIGNKVLFGPHLSIIGGDHRISDVGRYIFDVLDKQPGDDMDVVIEDDVWVAANVTILKGVTIKRGAVIAAGAVVTQDIPPYAIAGGIPARVLKYRFSEEDIKKHEQILSVYTM